MVRKRKTTKRERSSGDYNTKNLLSSYGEVHLRSSVTLFGCAAYGNVFLTDVLDK